MKFMFLDFVKGDKIGPGGCFKVLADSIKDHGTSKSSVLVECRCGNRFDVILYRITSKVRKQTTCGAQCPILRKEQSERAKEYWLEKKTDPNYKPATKVKKPDTKVKPALALADILSTLPESKPAPKPASLPSDITIEFVDFSVTMKRSALADLMLSHVRKEISK